MAPELCAPSSALLSLFGAAALPDVTWWHLLPWLFGALGLGTVGATLLAHFAPPPPPTDDVTAWPNRKTFLLATLFFTSIAIYGSLVPFTYRAMDWQAAIERFGQTPYLNLGPANRADWVANILLFIPISFCWVATLTFGRRSTAWKTSAYVCVVLACAGLCVLIEFTQIWFPPRTVSQNDVLAETLGALTGGLLWLSAGERLTMWIRGYAQCRDSKTQFDWILELYFFGFFIFSILPLDLTISLTELAHKFRIGRVQVIPFSDFQFTLAWTYETVRDVVLFIPIGILAATYRMSKERPVRSLWFTLFLAGCFAAVVEMVQLLIYSRFSSSTDLVTSLLGAAIGVWLMARWHRQKVTAVHLSENHRNVAIWLAASLLYAAFLIIISCAPFGPIITDGPELQARYEGFYRVPFASIYRGSEMNAINQVLRRVLFFVPLGVFFAIAVSGLRAPVAIRQILLAFLWCFSILIAFSIEMAQVFIDGHIPDITDVLLRPVGTGLAMLVTWRILKARRQGH